jgi:hypothetical protein
VAGLALAVLAAGALVWWQFGRSPPAGIVPAGRAGSGPAAETTASFVGSGACADCHRDAYQRWQQSQHAIAMQVASEQTVLGDFSGAKFRNSGVTSRGSSSPAFR